MRDPLEIVAADLDEAGEAIEIEWGDGHRSRYRLAYLRSRCPCAVCRTEREEARRNPFHVLKQVPSAALADMEPVGRYGIRPVWRDGHSTGIYTLEYLREICPCPECGGERSPAEPPFAHGLAIPKEPPGRT